LTHIQWVDATEKISARSLAQPIQPQGGVSNYLFGLAAACGAMAQDSGVYVGVDGGYHWPSSIKAESDFNDAVSGYDHPYSWRWNSETSWAAFARLG
jgi:hypothetical protein